MECTLCHLDKPTTEFDRGRRQCKRCRLDQKKRRYDPAKQKIINARDSWRVRAQRYGLTEEELRFRWALQEQRCAICDRAVDRPHVDHDHRSGRVRGLLCASCNRILGLARDRPERLERAAAYLRR